MQRFPAVILSIPVYFLLVATGLAAGLVDSIAGGGGLIALPVLLNLGLPPGLALGTNKFQSCCGTLTASRHYVNEGVVDLRSCRPGIAFTFVGALLGAFAVEQINSGALARIIPWLLAAILAYTVFRPKVGKYDHPPRLPATAFFAVAGPGLGFYDGFFGPGAGSLWTISLILLLGQNFTRATGYTKIMNATSNLASLALFIPTHRVLFPAGIAMAAGQVAGARLGSGLVVKKGARFIRPIFLTIVALTLARLLYGAGHR